MIMLLWKGTFPVAKANVRYVKAVLGCFTFDIHHPLCMLTRVKPPSKWDWMWPSLCRLDLERTGSVGELLTDCEQGRPCENSDEEMGLSR